MANKISRPNRASMAGMIYDANESLNWILGDPNVKEAFRNSSMVGNSIISDFRSGRSSNFRKSSSYFRRSSSDPAALAPAMSSTDDSAECKDSSNAITQESRSNSLSQLFNDDEERDLLGIGFFTIFEAGLVVSGYAGTGIVLSRNVMTGEWSGPVAVGVSGLGAGVLFGASVKTIVYLIYDYFTLKSIIGTDGGLIFGMGAGATVGTWTKDTGKQTAYITSPKMLRTAGMGSNVALCRGRAGIYGNMSVEAGICKCRDRINARFYGKESINGSDILLSGENIEIPNNTAVGNASTSNYQAKRLLEKIHAKLGRLCNRDGSDHEKSSDIQNDTEKENKEANATLEELYADRSFDCLDYEENIDDMGAKKNETTPITTTPLATSPLSSENNAQ